MAKELRHDAIRLKIGFDINAYTTSSDKVSLFMYDDDTPTKIPNSTRYMVVVDVPIYKTLAPDVITKDLAEIAEEVE
jgi:hypothetical protein